MSKGKKTIWVVVHGEECIPEGFSTKEDAEMFMELDTEGNVVSGPWEINCSDDECFTRYDPGEQGRAVHREVADA